MWCGVHVGVRRQPWVTVLAFHFIWRKSSCYCHCPSGSMASKFPGILLFHLPSCTEALGRPMSTTMSVSMWTLGVLQLVQQVLYPPCHLPPPMLQNPDKLQEKSYEEPEAHPSHPSSGATFFLRTRSVLKELAEKLRSSLQGLLYLDPNIKLAVGEREDGPMNPLSSVRSFKGCA